MKPLDLAELEAGLETIRKSPKDHGVVVLIVCRPESGSRQVLQQAHLELTEGVVGDNWKNRGSSKTPDGSAHLEMQVNIMNARAIALIAADKSRWPLAGDQLYIDLDLSSTNLPAGTRLKIGSAVIEVSSLPHTGCKKFSERFGLDALKFVNSPTGKDLHLRGINARIIQPGVIRVGDVVSKCTDS